MEHRPLGQSGRAFRGGTSLIPSGGGPAAPRWLLAALAIVSFAIAPPKALAEPSDLILAVTASNLLIGVQPSAPSTVVSSIRIGLPVGETLISLDVRPATGQLYGLSATGRLLLIDPASGRVIAVRATPILDPIAEGGADLDFDPITDTILVVGRQGRLLTIDPATTTVLASHSITAAITGVAFADDGRCYVIDAGRLAILTPTTGVIQPIASIDSPTTVEGLDIAPDGSALTLLAGSTLASIALETGRLTHLGSFGDPILAFAARRPGQPSVPAGLPSTSTAVAQTPVTSPATPTSIVGPATPTPTPLGPTPTYSPAVGSPTVTPVSPSATTVPGLPSLPALTATPSATPTTVFPNALPLGVRWQPSPPVQIGNRFG